MRLRATSRSPRDAGPAIFGLATWLLLLSPSSPTLFPQCLCSRKTVAKPSCSITENLQVVPKHLRKCCQAFNFSTNEMLHVSLCLF